MKERIDKILVDKGFFDTRERAKKNIMAGTVLVNNMVVDKPGMIINDTDEIRVKQDAIPYVSRGGLKLEKAMEKWSLSLNEMVCMDIGSSTGGFTDCMLQSGADSVYSVDVGYGQLDWKLRNDPRVIVMERTNIRHVLRESLPKSVDFFSIDVSFISLNLVLPKLKELGSESFTCVALIKPQFEVGRSEVGKNGVVREPSKHKKAIMFCIEYANKAGLFVEAVDYSPIKGPKGNIEFLMLVKPFEENQIQNDMEPLIDTLVNNAHSDLDN